MYSVSVKYYPFHKQSLLGTCSKLGTWKVDLFRIPFILMMIFYWSWFQIYMIYIKTLLITGFFSLFYFWFQLPLFDGAYSVSYSCFTKLKNKQNLIIDIERKYIVILLCTCFTLVQSFNSKKLQLIYKVVWTRDNVVAYWLIVWLASNK